MYDFTGLEVEIPSCFQEKLVKRFTPGNAVLKDENWRISIRCALCEFHKTARCCGCPFEQFEEGGHVAGCNIWFEAVWFQLTQIEKVEIRLEGEVTWSDDDDDKVRPMLNKLIEVALDSNIGLIKWV